MPVFCVPDDILYLIFETLDEESRPTSIWNLPRQHPLAPLTYVCKRWKIIADKIMRVNVGVVTRNGLHRLLRHLDANADQMSARTRARGLWIGQEVCDTLSPSQAGIPEKGTAQLDSLNSLLRLFPALDWVDAFSSLSAQCLSTLLDATGPTLRELDLVATPSTWDAVSSTKMNVLERLEIFSCCFVDQPFALEVPAIQSFTIRLPSLRVLRLSFTHWSAACTSLMDGLVCDNLTAVDLRYHGMEIHPDVAPAFQRFLQRQKGSIRRLVLSPPPFTDTDAFIVPLEGLEYLDMRARPRPSTVSALPKSVTDLGLMLVQSDIIYNGRISTDDQWEFLEELTNADLPALKRVRALDCHPSLDWTTLEATTQAVTDKFRASSTSLKMKGIDLLDTAGRTYTPVADVEER